MVMVSQRTKGEVPRIMREAQLGITAMLFLAPMHQVGKSMQNLVPQRLLLSFLGPFHQVVEFNEFGATDLAQCEGFDVFFGIITSSW